MYKCKYCGKEYNSGRQLGGHTSRCELNPNHSNNKGKKYKFSCSSEWFELKDGLFCEFCGKKCKNLNSLSNHERLCKLNPNHTESPFTEYNKIGHSHQAWNKGLTKETDIRIKNHSVKLIKTYAEKGGTFTGRHHSSETREVLREIAISRRSRGGYSANYSKKACLYIDELNKVNGWNLQHAENGGEVIVGGYFLDGYDKELNIAFEYDESKHYLNVYDNLLKEKDIERMNFIKSKLGCRFFRYNEAINLLYEV